MAVRPVNGGLPDIVTAVDVICTHASTTNPAASTIVTLLTSEIKCSEAGITVVDPLNAFL